MENIKLRFMLIVLEYIVSESGCFISDKIQKLMNDIEDRLKEK